MVENTKPSFPKALAEYLQQVKDLRWNETYEIVALMSLSDSLLSELNTCVEEFSTTHEGIDSDLYVFEEVADNGYEKNIDQIVESSYFVNNYTDHERVRAAELAKKCFHDIRTKMIHEKLFPGDKILYGSAILNPEKALFPLISHEIRDNGDLIIKASKDISLRELNEYAQHEIGLKNKPKKRKRSLGKMIRLLMIDEGVRANKDLIDRPYTYIEEIVCEKFFHKYGESITIEDAQKSLQRIKKIKKELSER